MWTGFSLASTTVDPWSYNPNKSQILNFCVRRSDLQSWKNKLNWNLGLVVSPLCQLLISFVSVDLCAPTAPMCGGSYLEMSTGKATAPSAAAMPSTIEVSTRMLPCSGESAALRRSAERPGRTFSIWVRPQSSDCLLMRPSVNCTHPRCCSSVCTALECCSTLGYCSRCCLNWARLTTTPVVMEMHTEVAVSHPVLWHGTPCPT